MENTTQVPSDMQTQNNSLPQSKSIPKEMLLQKTPSYDQDLQDVTEKTDLAPERRRKKKYSVITQQVREKFINKVLSKEATIKEAAEEFGLKFSTSKAILQTYKKEGRIGKKKKRERKTQVVNTVVVAAINPLERNLMPPTVMKDGPTASRIEQTPINLSFLKDTYAERNALINNAMINLQNSALSNLQNNAEALKFQQQFMPAGLNQNRLGDFAMLNSHHYTGILPTQGLCLPNASMQQKLLLDAVLQGSNADFMLAKQLNQQIVTAAQNKLYQHEQLNPLNPMQNLGLQSQMLSGMGGLRPEAVPNLSNFGLLGAREMVPGTNLFQNGLDLGRNFTPNPVNFQDYQALGSIPTKKIFFSGLNKPNFL